VRKMKTQFQKLRTIALLAVLPLVATAAASAQQWMTDNSPISGEGTTLVSTVKPALTGRMHTVALNRAGAVEGRVAAIDRNTKELQGLGGLSVFFVRDGKVVQQTKTSLDGSFIVEGLAEGAYSFVATGDAGFVAYGVQVVAEGQGNGANIMEASAVSRSLAAIKDLLGKQLPAQVANEIAKAAKSFDGQLIGSNRVQLDGKKLKGRLTALVGALESVKGTVVHLFRDGQKVAEVSVDASGEFVIENLDAGVYEFIASGSAGFAAISFEALDAALVDTDDMAVAIQDVIADSGYLDVGLAAQGDAGFVSDSVTYTSGDFTAYNGGDCVGTSFGCGGAVGGSCGACGGGMGGGMGGGRGLFGRGGGLGRLLLLGAAIAIPLAVSSPGPATPSQL
jgi:hypothetical protein